MFLWLGFIVCTSVIVYSGTKLSKYGDIIAEKIGLGRMWIGVVLMASGYVASGTCYRDKLGHICRCA